jgi:hypothetical protein
MVSNNHFAPLWLGTTFSQAVSLGNFCHSAQVLKDLGYRIFSGPFDWIFSNPRALSHILSDDFKVFLDRSYYYPVPVHERKVPEANFCEHLFYKQNFGIHHLFNHHLPNEENDYFHYLQAVQEFRSTLKSSEPVLYLIVSNHRIHLDQYLELVKSLDAYGGTYRLLVIHFMQAEDIASSLGENVNTTYHDEKLLIVDLKVKGLSIGNTFTAAEDNLRFADLLRSFKVGSSHGIAD